jgi:hypothetical protein
METSTSIHFTTTKAFTMTFVADASQTASFKIDGTTVTGTGNIASVDVAAGPHTLTKSGAIKMCFLDFAETSTPVDPEPTQSSDATLSALSVAGYSLTPAFSSSTFTYSVELAAGTTSVPSITATPNHSKAHAYVDTESCHPTGQAIIDVEAEDGTSGKYYINFTVSEELNLTDAAEYVDGTFAAGKVTYTRSTTNGKYGSFCLPFDFNASEVEGIAKIYVPVNIVVYNTSTNKLRLFLELKTGTISAGTPFLALFNGATTVNNSASATFTSVMSNPPSVNMDVFDSNGSDGALLESEDITVTWNGTYVKTDRVDGMKSFNSNGDFGDHTVATISAFRAYLVVTSATVNSQDIDVELTLGDATGIYELTNTVESVKNVDVYTIGGIRVKSRVPYGKALDGLLPGSYIINGKIVIK